MNLPKMIAELQAERDRLDEAILALERLSVSNARRRGRPPRWSREESPAAAAAAVGSAASIENAGEPN